MLEMSYQISLQNDIGEIVLCIKNIYPRYKANNNHDKTVKLLLYLLDFTTN